MIAFDVRSNTAAILRDMKIMRSDLTDKAQILALNRAMSQTATAARKRVRHHLRVRNVDVKRKLVPRRATRYSRRALLHVLAGGLSYRALGRAPRPGKREFNATMPNGGYGVFRRESKARLPIVKAAVAFSPSLMKYVEHALDTVAPSVYQQRVRHEITRLLRNRGRRHRVRR